MLRASNTFLEAQFLSLRWPGNLSGELGRPFPLNKRLLGSPSLAPSQQCPAGDQRAQSRVALAEGSSYRKH